MFIRISVPSVLDCGSCLDGDSKKWTTQCVNFGGEGRFKLMLPTQKDDIALVSPHDRQVYILAHVF